MKWLTDERSLTM